MMRCGLALSFLCSACAFGLDLGDDLQVHGTVAQGGLLSSHNNYLTAQTSQGSTQWTEAALNASASFSDRFHIGVQVHTYRLGELGKFKPELDWAYADYRIAEALGVRAGKVKTPLGLFNDTQDVDTLYLWALLPQGVYPADNRSWTLAHTGGDVYGTVALPPILGRLSYQGYYGSRTADSNEGYFRTAADDGMPVANGANGRLYGGDLRWHAPFRGLLVGASLGLADTAGKATMSNLPAPVTIRSTSDTNTAMYAELERGKFYAAGEFRRRIWNLELVEPNIPVVALDSRAWYVMGAYRIRPKLNLGGYFSRFRFAPSQALLQPTPLQEYSKDWVLSARIDPKPYLYLKLEGHYISGAANGLYPSANPTGFDRLTRLLVARIGLTF